MTARIEKSIAAHPDYCNYRISRSIRGVTTRMVAEVRDAMVSPLKQPKAVAIALPQAVLSSRAPLRRSSIHRIHGLPKGVGFELSELALEWGVSVSTIQGHACSLKCLRYLEVAGEWIQVVMHPETAKQHS